MVGDETLPALPEPYGLCNDMRLDASQETETTENPLIAIYDIWRGFDLHAKCYAKLARSPALRNSTQLSFEKLSADIHFFSPITYVDFLVIAIMAAIWTLARYFITKKFLQPFSEFLGVLPENKQKFCESAWKTVAFSFMWTSAVYVTFFRGYDYFEKTLQQWGDWRLREARADLLAVYAIEASFYVHAVFTAVFMDVWRKDFFALILHHVVTLLLISFSRLINVLKIGLIIFVLDDVNDILLESGKCFAYLRWTRFGYSRAANIISDAIAVMFAVCWVVLRLHLHLTRVWRSALLGPWVSLPVLPIPFQLFLCVLLGCLYGFYIYWFYFIVIFIWRIVVVKSKAEDPRETADDTRTRHSTKNHDKKE